MNKKCEHLDNVGFLAEHGLLSEKGKWIHCPHCHLYAPPSAYKMEWKEGRLVKKTKVEKRAKPELHKWLDSSGNEVVCLYTPTLKDKRAQDQINKERKEREDKIAIDKKWTNI